MCVCVCVCSYCGQAVLAVPVGLSVPACLLQRFPVEMTGHSSPMSLGPCVISLVLSASSFFASHLSPSHVQGALTSPTFLRASLSASFDQAPLGYLPPCPLPRPGKPRGRYAGGFNVGPSPPGVPVPAPPHLGRGGGPRKGPPLHRCCRPCTAGAVLGLR